MAIRQTSDIVIFGKSSKIHFFKMAQNTSGFTMLMILLCCSALSSLHGANGQIKLSKLNIDPEKVSVSGISSGAAMATQFHFAHSSEIFGAGVYAGVPYMCGYGGLQAALTCMETPLLVNVPFLIREATAVENAGNIDSTSNIRDSKVYIFHGTKDSTVKPASGRNIEQMYAHYGADMKTEFDIPAEHGQPTDNYGAPCGSASRDFGFINNCDYNGAFEMANYLYGGNLIRPNATTQPSGDFNLFDQSEFFNFNPSLSSMDTAGFIYVPSGCKNGERRCALHIAFHGCQQYRRLLGETFPKRTGYLEVAELNDIVLLFPQTVQTMANPNGCWDWWGYLNVYFPTKIGNQVLATYRMMNRLIKE